jgi:hypothetical protein
MRGSPNHTTREIVSTFLRTAGEPRPVRQICRYAHQMHRIDQGATREQLRRLLKEGKVTNPERGVYAWASDE